MIQLEEFLLQGREHDPARTILHYTIRTLDQRPALLGTSAVPVPHFDRARIHEWTAVELFRVVNDLSYAIVCSASGFMSMKVLPDKPLEGDLTLGSLGRGLRMDPITAQGPHAVRLRYVSPEACPSSPDGRYCLQKQNG